MEGAPRDARPAHKDQGLPPGTGLAAPEELGTRAGSENVDSGGRMRIQGSGLQDQGSARGTSLAGPEEPGTSGSERTVWPRMRGSRIETGRNQETRRWWRD